MSRSTSAKSTTKSPSSETRDGIILYHYWRSSAAWRVRWALAAKGISYEKRAVNLLKGEQYSPEYLRLNPAGQVPALVWEGHIFGESLAILEFLEEKFPHIPLLPNDPGSRLYVRQLCLNIVAGTHPLQNLLPQKMHSDDPETRKKWVQFFIARGLEVHDKKMEGHSGSFSLGGELTIADLCLVPQIYNAIRFDVPFAHLPNVKRVYENCRKLASCEVAAPENQPDAVK